MKIENAPVALKAILTDIFADCDTKINAWHTEEKYDIAPIALNVEIGSAWFYFDTEKIEWRDAYTHEQAAELPIMSQLKMLFDLVKLYAGNDIYISCAYYPNTKMVDLHTDYYDESSPFKLSIVFKTEAD